MFLYLNLDTLESKNQLFFLHKEKKDNNKFGIVISVISVPLIDTLSLPAKTFKFWLRLDGYGCQGKRSAVAWIVNFFSREETVFIQRKSIFRFFLTKS